MVSLDSAIHVLDVNFLGQPGAVACGLIAGAGGIALVDPGPSSSLPGLRAALAGHGHSLADVRAILVTHIHLDHSGACGTIVRDHPDIEVIVHERGAPHMIEPGRLLRSAARVYGDGMERLWGEVAPVPAARVRALAGGERLVVAGRQIATAYTPGHAVHHLSYLDEASGTACTGDAGGMVIGAARFVVPPTPPPDVDVELWDASVSRIREWQPRSLFVTHFGLVADPGRHLDALVVRLRRLAAIVRESLAVDGPDAHRLAWFRRVAAADLRSVLAEPDAQEIERDFMFDESWHGLARYWRRKDPGLA
ncbi:MAG: MBL fold metallo-hydrolase [Chloroflexi bacterium]|nr:MBL fold metallo-hydrolase [Chloroflexota bacterium]